MKASELISYTQALMEEIGGDPDVWLEIEGEECEFSLIHGIKTDIDANGEPFNLPGDIIIKELVN
jgi:hypothetical protein